MTALQPLDMKDQIRTMRPDLLIQLRRMLAAMGDMSPTEFLAAFDAFSSRADGIYQAMTIETWAPAADTQSSSVLAQELPGIPSSLVEMHQAGVLRILHEDLKDNS